MPMRIPSPAFVALGLVAFVLGLAHGDEDIKIQNDGDRRMLVAHNPFLCTETISVSATLQNMNSTVPLPATLEVPAGATRTLCVFSPADPQNRWNYNYTYHNFCGSRSATPDNSVVYLLPYPRGMTWKVIQGFNGKFSHGGQYNHALDWGMPAGSSICAARDGLVVKVKADSDQGGPTKDFQDKANYIDIIHADGTIGEYLHLQHNGVRVTVGQRVRAGDVIALSGATGFASGPHLHFHVCVPVDGEIVRTFPIQFRLDPQTVAVPQAGQNYTAP